MLAERNKSLYVPVDEVKEPENIISSPKIPET